MLFIAAILAFFLVSSRDKFVVPFSSILFNNCFSDSEITAKELAFFIIPDQLSVFLALSRSSFSLPSVICTISETALLSTIDSNALARYAN